MILRVLIPFILFCLEQNSVFSNDSKILKMVHLVRDSIFKVQA